MITFSQFGNGKTGNLGNQLFQYASMMGIAEKKGYDLTLPQWKYSQYFQGEFPTGKSPGILHRIKEPHYHYEDFTVPENADLSGWFQSEKYWVHSKAKVLQALSFTDEFKESCNGKISGLRPESKRIAISVRRGDYVGNPNYELLPASYYYLALFEHFPDWKEYNILFFSDDIDYCKRHFECLPNATFADGLSDIEQLCLMSQCQHFIIANSTFSWWGAYLSQTKGKIIRPNYLFAGKLLQENNDKDFWPESWEMFDHKDKRLNAKDVTFTIPVLHDHNDRRQNLNLAVCMLQRDFETNIIIGEQKTREYGYMDQWCKYMHFTDMKNFHRTKMLNDMCYEAQTPIVANWDADVILPPLQVYLALEAIRNGAADMVYPYDGRFARVGRALWFAKVERFLDVGVITPTIVHQSSVGGCVIVHKESFIMSGCENENMISYGPEDCERYDRWNMLEYKVKRIPGMLFHIEHHRGVDSTTSHPLFKANNAEHQKVKAMGKEELTAYVRSWPWVRIYTEQYYREISEGSKQSAGIVLDEVRKIVKFNSVVDVGCGIGAWANGMDYTGIDHGIMKRALLIPESNYIDCDLRHDLPPVINVDLAICLEVAEHLPESRAADLVEYLCKCADYVLFSAAIPYQGGHDHINEQWQSWWAGLFKENGFGANAKQPDIRDNQDVEVWYRNNIILYKKGAKGKVSDYVNPDLWLNVRK